MKNIAFMTPDLKSGGSERVASELTKLLSDRYKVYYIVFDDSDISYDIDAELININAVSTSFLPKKVLNLFKRTYNIHKICREKNIDMIFSFTDNANLSMRLSRLECRMMGACRGFEDLKNHTGNYHKIIKAGGEILFNSREMEEYYKSKYPQDLQTKLHTIENLLDCRLIEQNSKEPLNDKEQGFFDNHRVVSTCGILSKHKGHWDLIKSFELLKKKMPDAGLVIVGHRGNFEKEIHRMAENSKYAKDILFTGYTGNPFKYVARSEVYALSSINEGFPNALLEAMAVRVPCVAAACATGPNEIMYDSYTAERPKDDYVLADNGILTPVFDGVPDFDNGNISQIHEIYANALYRVLSDETLSRRYSLAGYNRALRNDKSAIAHKYFDLIENRKDEKSLNYQL